MTSLPPDGFLVKPDPDGIDTTEHIVGLDQLGEVQTQCVIEEHPLTIFLNNREIVTLMTIRDYPEMLSVGYLVNQQMLKDCDIITDIEYDAEIDVCVVRTHQTTAYEHRLKRKVLTSGCGMGTLFGDIMDTLSVPDQINAQTLAASAIIRALKVIKDTPSLYQKAGSIHACVVCHADQPLIYMEDVGRHNALDKIAGYIHLHKPDIPAPYLYTTGRLTSEMVIKSLSMNIPVVISRSGATHWAIKLAKQYGQTLITRARGKRFQVLSCPERLIFDLPAQGSVS
ncbi:formate dehydrogenase accessory sulfurtransferase FdhD [Terasakiella pusilla]|uniref:formate dehydrogenase accessory sulfurtransferase FdhD n=1 Tax=Terasakiella pusilla TaxID=64973 RepID=UPI003AA8A54D